MRRKVEQQAKEKVAEGFAGREALASIMDEEITGRFSLKQLRVAVASAALESELSGQKVADVISSLPKSRRR